MACLKQLKTCDIYSLMSTKLIIALLLISLSSCQIADWQKITHYNDEVTTTNDSIYVKGKRIGEAVNKGMMTGDYSAATAKTDSLQLFVKNQIDFFSHKLDIDGSDTLRLAELGYLKFEENVIQQHFYKFGRFNGQTPENEVKQALSELAPIAAYDHTLFEQVSDVQVRYAKAHGFPFTKSTYKNMFQ